MSLELKNVPFREYLKMDENDAFLYTYSFQHGQQLRKAVNHYELSPLRTNTFGKVKDAQQLIEAGVVIADLPKVIQPFTPNNLLWGYGQGVFEVFQQFAWVRKQIEDILEIERMALVRKLSDRELKAGVERFEVYGVYPQLRAVANAFGQTIEWARALPYDDAFLELCYQKDLSEYEIDVSQVKE